MTTFWVSQSKALPLRLLLWLSQTLGVGEADSWTVMPLALPSALLRVSHTVISPSYSQENCPWHQQGGICEPVTGPPAAFVWFTLMHIPPMWRPPTRHGLNFHSLLQFVLLPTGLLHQHPHFLRRRDISSSRKKNPRQKLRG